MIAEGLDPTPIPAERVAAIQKASQPIDYNSFIPERQRWKFIRYEVAEFNPVVAEALRDLTYDRLKEMQFMQTAHSRAVARYRDNLPKTNG
jgi:hypothetical protein